MKKNEILFLAYYRDFANFDEEVAEIVEAFVNTVTNIPDVEVKRSSDKTIQNESKRPNPDSDDKR